MTGKNVSNIQCLLPLSRLIPTAQLARYFRNRNSRPIFTRLMPSYSMMSAVA
jgi:hypothetical protein